MNNRKLCGRITDHLGHHWAGMVPTAWHEWSGPQRVQFWCPGHVVVEGGSCAARHTEETHA